MISGLIFRSVSSGWESRICASVEEEAGGREENVSNYSEIVSFLQNNWQAYSKAGLINVFS